MTFSSDMATEQPPPVATDAIPTWGLVIGDLANYCDDPLRSAMASDMAMRDLRGRETYGVPLQAGNGRDSLRDALEEAYDLAVYLRNAMVEAESMPDGTESEVAAKRTMSICLMSNYGNAMRTCVGLRSLVTGRDQSCTRRPT